jgi:hypothetical protein
VSYHPIKIRICKTEAEYSHPFMHVNKTGAHKSCRPTPSIKKALLWVIWHEIIDREIAAEIMFEVPFALKKLF